MKAPPVSRCQCWAAACTARYSGAGQSQGSSPLLTSLASERGSYMVNRVSSRSELGQQRQQVAEVQAGGNGETFVPMVSEAKRVRFVQLAPPGLLVAGLDREVGHARAPISADCRLLK